MLRAIKWNAWTVRPLADAIDAADALLESHRVPRQLEVDDEPALPVEVEPLRGGVGGEQQPSWGPRELGEDRCAFFAIQAAMQNERRDAWQRLLQEALADVHQRVAILGEHNRRFAGAPEEPPERRELRFMP